MCHLFWLNDRGCASTRRTGLWMQRFLRALYHSTGEERACGKENNFEENARRARRGRRGRNIIHMAGSRAAGQFVRCVFPSEPPRASSERKRRCRKASSTWCWSASSRWCRSPAARTCRAGALPPVSPPRAAPRHNPHPHNSGAERTDAKQGDGRTACAAEVGRGCGRSLVGVALSVLAGAKNDRVGHLGELDAPIVPERAAIVGKEGVLVPLCRLRARALRCVPQEPEHHSRCGRPEKDHGQKMSFRRTVHFFPGVR